MMNLPPRPRPPMPQQAAAPMPAPAPTPMPQQPGQPMPQQSEQPVIVGAKASAPSYLLPTGANAGELGQPWNLRFARR